MKKRIFVWVATIVCMFSCTDGLRNDIDDLKNKYNELDSRVARLELLCGEMNTNISALQTIVDVILSNDYIVNVTPIYRDGAEIGYTITFAIHSPITIYHGQNGADGKDGQNGKDGQDGVTPIIGVALDPTDNAYYWTLNGDWLLDVNGNRIPLTSRDGKNGQDGQPGQNGQDGKDGITPQLKIENGYWYVSTDNGATWTQLGKAVGENGQDGKDGKDGQDGKDGDSMFSSVTQDENFVYFTLANGTVLTVSKERDNKVYFTNGIIPAPFSVSATKKVYFSQGNLQYQASTNTWRFAFNQFDRMGLNNDSISPTYAGWIDLFGWGTSGWNSGANEYQPYSTSTNSTDYYPGGSNTQDLIGDYANGDWGVYNAISNGGNQNGLWRVLQKHEWDYLINERTNADNLKTQAIVNYVPGLILFPDDWVAPWGIYTKLNGTDYGDNNYDVYHWNQLEQCGAVFLPACGGRDNSNAPNSYLYNSYQGYYWSSTSCGNDNVWILLFGTNKYVASTNTNGRCNGRSVRLVKDVE